jgi:serine/threonine protein kinase
MNKMSNDEIEILDVKDNKSVYVFRKYGRLQKVETLGEGSFGKVILAKKIDVTNQEDSKEFAIKISKGFRKFSKKVDQRNGSEDKNKEEEKRKELNFVELRELYIMKKIKHQNVINLLDFNLNRKDKELCILMEYLHTDLGKFFQENRQNPNVMNEDFLKNISFQILSGLNYLHENNIIHRDIKLENILYDSRNNIVKIGDFGLSRQFDYDLSTIYTDVGTYPYKPPELLLGLTHYSTSFDIWSTGCILVEICTGTHLFGKNNALEVISLMYKIFGSFNEAILPGFKNFPNSKILETLPATQGIGLVNYIKENKKFDFVNDDFYNLIEKMLCIDPTKRINAKDCLAHRWFSNKN